jgi:hypothetical protein
MASMAAEDVKAATEKISSTSAQITSTANTYKAALEKATAGHQPQAGPTRAPDPRAKARDAIRARQVLLDTQTTEGQSPWKELSNTAILDKARAAAHLVDESNTHKFVGVTRLRNGGLLLEMNSEDGAKWLKSDTTRDKFLGSFDPSATFRERAYTVVAQFVPLTF